METITEPNAFISTANVTDDREACSFCWYAARTQMNCERKAEREFSGIALETYLPTQEEIHQWSDRKKKVQRVVIPMILFVKMSADEAKNVHRTPYFYGFLGHDRRNSQPQPIPEREIETLRFMLGHSDRLVEFEDASHIKFGDKVRVVRGSLKGLEGNVIVCNDGLTYVGVNLNILGCAKVSIDKADLTVIE